MLPLPPLLAIVSLSLFSTVHSFQIPFQLPFFNKDDTPLNNINNDTPHRIAIIGAGAGGSSAAYWLSQAANRYPELVKMQVDLYDKESYIGGRSTVVRPHDSELYDPVELGASIFVDANKNLFRAVEEFGLSLSNFGEEDEELGIWDGTSFRFRIAQKNGSFSWWDMIRILFRYGLTTPQKAQSLVDQAISSYVNVYNTSFKEWSTIPDAASNLGFSDLLPQTIEAYMLENGVSQLYIDEFVEAFTRVNYAHDVTKIHALEGLISQATSGATSVKGGNYQIFQEFVSRSSAKVYLNTVVTSLTKKDDTWTLTTANGESRVYESIILAAPFHLSGITTDPSLSSVIPPQPYIHLHVTLLTTGMSNPRPEYFSLKPDSSTPTSVLTTNANFRAGEGPAPEFNSLSYLGRIKGQDGRPDEYVVKIFSMQPIESSFLRTVFGRYSWIYRKEWDSYPVLPPNITHAPVVPAEGLYYVNSFEPFISTMETETVSSLNAVRLLLEKVFGSSAIACPESQEGEPPVMKGWDC